MLTSLCLMSSAFSVLVAHRQMELETEVAELRAEIRSADLTTAASEDVTFVRQRRLRREAGGDQGRGASMLVIDYIFQEHVSKLFYRK